MKDLEKIKSLREALSFYGDEKNWEESCGGGCHCSVLIPIRSKKRPEWWEDCEDKDNLTDVWDREQDSGEKAREALKEFDHG